MADYPAFIQRMLSQAREQGQWYCGQSDAAAICFDVLALFPDHAAAAELVYQLFCDEWLIYDTRNALQQQIDEWDDRPWQQRRRLALSLRFMSRWPGWHDEQRRGVASGDVAGLLQQGRDLLLEAYCLGDEECTDLAWPLFVAAFRRSASPHDALLWVGRQYADLGFFADAAEVLAELCARFDDPRARRLLAEVRWWRDNAHRLPWIPPPGDGTRYQRMIVCIDPSLPDGEDTVRDLRARSASRRAAAAQPAPAGPAWRPVIAPEVARLVAAALPPEAGAAPASAPLVDWSFLDRDNGQPGEMPEWALKTMRMFRASLTEDMVRRYRWSRPIPRPATPPRYDPNEPPIEHDTGVDDEWPPDDDASGPIW